MSSLPSFDTENEPKIARSVEKFFKDYKVMELLRRCGLRKSKGIPLWSILSYIFSNVFRDRSMYMQQKYGKCTAGFSKNTYYRFMQNPHINWLRLTILLAERIVNGHLKDLTSDQRADCFVFDDSLYYRTGYKKTELAAKVFDHVSMTYKKGFRMMTMGWTDGSSFVPIASSLLSSKNDQNVIGTTKKIDKRTIAAKRRIMAQSKGTDVVIQLLDQALKAGLTAKYVMFGHLVLQSSSDCPNQSTWFERNRHGEEKLQDHIRVRRKANERQADLQRMQEASRSFKISPVRPCKGWRSCQRWCPD